MTNIWQHHGRFFVCRNRGFAGGRSRKKLGPPAEKDRSGLDIPSAREARRMAGSVKEKWHCVACLPSVFPARVAYQRMDDLLPPFFLHRTDHKVGGQLGCQVLQPLTFSTVAPRVSSFRYGRGGCGVPLVIGTNRAL